MGRFSVWHWLVVLVVIVLLFGSKKIPELAKGVANGIKTFKKEIKDDEAEKIEEKKDMNEEKRV